MPTPTAAVRGAQTVPDLLRGVQLSPALRQVARLVVDEPQFVAGSTAVDVAHRLKVSQPTVTRFAMALGFAGFAELQRTLRAEAAHHPTGGTSRNDYRLAADADKRSIASLGSSLADPHHIEQVAQLCWESSPLLVVGSRIAAPMAHLFGHLSARFHPDIRTVQHLDSLAEEEVHRGRLGGATTLLVFAYPRYDAALPGFMHLARRSGYQCVVVTDHTVVPFTTADDLVLATGVGSELVFDSLAAATSMVSMLVHAIYEAGGDEAQGRLEEFEEFAEAAGLFLPATYRLPPS